MTRRPPGLAARSPTLGWVAAALASSGVLAVGLVALHRRGFVGISDDDAARTLLAWAFARTPSLDPTRSSWLPVHTYVLGAALAITRESWISPRLVSLLGAMGTTMLAILLAHRRGAAPLWATFATLTAAAFPWSLFAAWAPGVPEMPCCALFLAGATLVAAEDGSVPTAWRCALAGLCFTAASGHRYEAWFASAGFVLGAAMTWRRVGRVTALGLCACIVPLAWLAINHTRSGHAFEFVTRVVHYRGTHEALGSVRGRLARYPSLLLTHVGLLFALACLSVRKRPAGALPLLGAALAVIAALVVTDLRGGGATHHVARSLLLAVWCLAPLAAASLTDLARQHPRVASMLAALAFAQSASGLRTVPLEISSDTIAVGRTLGVMLGPEQKYFLELSRLDGLWIELASGAPDRVVADRTLDPPDTPVAPRVERAAGCDFAIVNTVAVRDALATHGFVALSSAGAWTLMRRSAPSGTR